MFFSLFTLILLLFSCDSSLSEKERLMLDKAYDYLEKEEIIKGRPHAAIEHYEKEATVTCFNKEKNINEKRKIQIGYIANMPYQESFFKGCGTTLGGITIFFNMDGEIVCITLSE